LAFTNEENYQARGIAGLHGSPLSKSSEKMASCNSMADVLAENRAMLTVFRRNELLPSGLPQLPADPSLGQARPP
jgi:hypothetical protein